MKHLFWVNALAILCVAFSSCTQHNNEIIDVEYPDGDMPLAMMMVVRFSNPDQKDNVIAGHPIKKYDGNDGQYIYQEDTVLTLCVNNMKFVMTEEMATFIEDNMPILGLSPYLYLTDDYYLVDWKWQDILPLSALTNYANVNAHHDQMDEHIKYHIFTTDTKWTELTDFSQTWDNSLYTTIAQVEEVQRIAFEKIDQLYDDVKKEDQYVCYNMSLYNSGLSLINAWTYYKNEGVRSCNPEGRYLEYLSYCDSMQNVYRARLTEMINKGQIK